MIRPPKGTKGVPSEVIDLFTKTLGAEFIEDLGKHWQLLIDEQQTHIDRIKIKVEKAFVSATVSATTRIDSETTLNTIDLDLLDKRALGAVFGVVRFVSTEMQKKGGDVSDEEKREAFYTTPAFQNRVFPMTKRMFRVHP